LKKNQNIHVKFSDVPKRFLLFNCTEFELIPPRNFYMNDFVKIIIWTLFFLNFSPLFFLLFFILASTIQIYHKGVLYPPGGTRPDLVGVVCSLTGVTGSEGPEREDSWLTLLAVEGAGLARWSTKTPTTSPVRGLIDGLERLRFCCCIMSSAWLGCSSPSSKLEAIL